MSVVGGTKEFVKNVPFGTKSIVPSQYSHIKDQSVVDFASQLNQPKDRRKKKTSDSDEEHDDGEDKEEKAVDKKKSNGKKKQTKIDPDDLNAFLEKEGLDPTGENLCQVPRCLDVISKIILNDKNSAIEREEINAEIEYLKEMLSESTDEENKMTSVLDALNKEHAGLETTAEQQKEKAEELEQRREDLEAEKKTFNSRMAILERDQRTWSTKLKIAQAAFAKAIWRKPGVHYDDDDDHLKFDINEVAPTTDRDLEEISISASNYNSICDTKLADFTERPKGKLTYSRYVEDAIDKDLESLSIASETRIKLKSRAVPPPSKEAEMSSRGGSRAGTANSRVSGRDHADNGGNNTASNSTRKKNGGMKPLNRRERLALEKEKQALKQLKAKLRGDALPPDHIPGSPLGNGSIGSKESIRSVSASMVEDDNASFTSLTTRTVRSAISSLHGHQSARGGSVKSKHSMQLKSQVKDIEFGKIGDPIKDIRAFLRSSAAKSMQRNRHRANDVSRANEDNMSVLSSYGRDSQTGSPIQMRRDMNRNTSMSTRKRMVQGSEVFQSPIHKKTPLKSIPRTIASTMDPQSDGYNDDATIGTYGDMSHANNSLDAGISMLSMSSAYMDEMDEQSVGNQSYVSVYNTALFYPDGSPKPTIRGKKGTMRLGNRKKATLTRQPKTVSEQNRSFEEGDVDDDLGMESN